MLVFDDLKDLYQYAQSQLKDLGMLGHAFRSFSAYRKFYYKKYGSYPSKEEKYLFFWHYYNLISLKY